jgi:translation initiation factor 3 subunit A
MLEVTFDPLTLCSSIAPLLQTLSTDESSYAPYHALLQRALLSRLLSQLSQVYSCIKISSVLELVAPLKAAGLEGAFDEVQVEAYVMGCARRGELNIRVDHSAGTITFLDDPFVSVEDPAPSAGSSGTVKEAEIQSSTVELVRTRLSKLAVCLHNSLVNLERSDSYLDDAESPDQQQEKFKALVAAAHAERKALQLRRALVARRRELLSELSVRKEKEETSRKAEISRREKEEEGRRVKEDIRRKEMERVKKVNDSIRVEEAKKLAQQLIDRGVLKGVTNEVSFVPTVQVISTNIS